MKAIHVTTLDDLNKAASTILSSLNGLRIVCLYGSMGAGKTTLIKAICGELGVTDTVVSPTFALVNEYRTPSNEPVFHFDFYRIERIEEVYDLGYEEYFYESNALCLIEWPELVEELLPSQGVLKLRIEVQPDGARVIKPISVSSM